MNDDSPPFEFARQDSTKEAENNHCYVAEHDPAEGGVNSSTWL